MDRMPCDRCGGPTTKKTPTSKRTGKPFTVYECSSGCKSGRYPYSFFPPRAQQQPAPAAVSQGSGGATFKCLEQIAGTLRELKACIERIEHMLANPNAVHVTPAERKTDDEVPF